MQRKWFKNKTYGYGWTPASWQGWMTVLIAVVLIVWKFRDIDQYSHSASDTLINFIPFMVFVIAILTIISYTFGAPPRWQWGNKEKPKQ